MATLTGSTQPIPLGEGYALRAPGIRGAADLQRPSTPADRARSRAPRDGTTALDEALQATNVAEVRQIEVAATPSGPAAATRGTRGEERAETIELQVPDLGPETGQLVLAADESGVMTWHLPVGGAAGPAGATRGGGAVKRFVIPAPQPAAPAPGETGKRGLIGIAGRQLLKVLVYPLVDPAICHSRGGLVARTIAEQPSVFGLDTSPLQVRRIVFVGVPNNGTMLAHPDHMVKMIDRLTTALNLFPTGAVTEILEAIITAVKVIGHGALKGLQGLASMQPEGEFLKKLNQGTPAGTGYYAIAADYEPTAPGLRALVAGSLADGVLDRVFEGTGNDLVVPEPGVYSANGSGAFPIPDERLFRVKNDAGVIHTTFFGHAPAWRKVAEWLA